MVSKIISGAVSGVDGFLVEVEADVSQGLPSFDIVGLPDSAVKESRERVRTAIKNTGMVFPVKHITVNLAPADTRKEGPAFDLPIAVGILTCMRMIDEERTRGILFTGELSLDGAVRPVNGVLAMAAAARDNGYKKIVVPYENGEEAALVEGIETTGVKNLPELIAHLSGSPLPPVAVDRDKLFEPAAEKLDFADVKGQEHVKRALEVAAAGGHNMLMIGPPGAGKTMMARRLPSIMPDLTYEESVEITKIYSVAGLLRNKKSLVTGRPFRSPHHTLSYAALTGGGRSPKPGEVSLSHHGVLFLDELPEFHKNVLEVLRQPMEDGHVNISRVSGSLTYPSAFMLVASMNPCPCGYYASGNKCTCTAAEIARYLGRISGPLIDRIDLQVETPAVAYKDLGSGHMAEKSADIKKRVEAARKRQRQRYGGALVNAQLSAAELERYCVLGEPEQEMIKQAFQMLELSARAYHKILKVARTIADLADREAIHTEDLAEAIQYRGLDRKYW